MRGGSNLTHIDSTIAAVKYALEVNLDMIQLDVWLTADNKLIVAHGGPNGEKNPNFIFESTLE
jgi:glycerophosphoryl diester phosphodiesterase